jgi:hypothetical protein
MQSAAAWRGPAWHVAETTRKPKGGPSPRHSSAFTHSRCSCSSCCSRSLHRLPVLGCGFRSRAPFFSGSVPGLSGTAFVLLPRESDCISRMLFPPLTLGFRELHFSRPVRTARVIAPAAALGFRSRFAYIRAGTEFFIKYLNASFFTPLPSRPQMPAS